MVGLADDVGFRGYSGSRIPGALGLSLTRNGSQTLAWIMFATVANASRRPDPLDEERFCRRHIRQIPVSCSVPFGSDIHPYFSSVVLS